jgi:8-oxo-dGTP pyrophosphatase MutT (NUDIX family)
MRAFHVTEQDVRLALLAPLGSLRGDGELDGALPPGPARLRPAAVLAPIARRPEGLTLILTQRPTTMREHAGQIALPGGKIDPTDRSPLAAALRESREEIGLLEDQIEILGPIERYRTRTGFVITPFVGLVDPAFTAIPEPGEVEAVFEAPLDWILNPANHRRMRAEFNGVPRSFWSTPWERWHVWGATSGIIRRLTERVLAAKGVETTPR